MSLIALIEDGDIISVDTIEGTINLEVPEEVIKERRKNWLPPEPKVKGTIGYIRQNLQASWMKVELCSLGI